MIGIDTNILLRYITRDQPNLTKRAAFVLEEQCSIDNPGFVSILCLSELYWVLKSAYQYSNEDISIVIQTLLNARELIFENEESVWHGLEQMKSGFGFADALIGHIATTNGCETTMTLDKKAAKMSNFTEA